MDITKHTRIPRESDLAVGSRVVVAIGTDPNLNRRPGVITGFESAHGIARALVAVTIHSGEIRPASLALINLRIEESA